MKRENRMKKRIRQRMMVLHGNPGLGGDQTTNLKKAEAFKFLAPH
jgi:hypothetical protein